MFEKLLKSVTDMTSPKILLAGDFMLDVSIYGEVSRISPHAPVPILNITDRRYNCGGAGFVAFDISALGGVAMCVGFAGDDKNGRRIVQLLESVGCETTGLTLISDRPTTTKQRLIGLADQHRYPQQLMRLDEESSDPLSDKNTAKILASFTKQLPKADIVCLQDYKKGLLTDSLCRQMIQLARAQNKPVLIDPHPDSDYSKYSFATAIMPNRREASIAVGFDIETIKDAAKAANLLKDKLKLEAVFITLDKDGIYLLSNNHDGLIATVTRDVYDTSGAGDMILAAIAMTTSAGSDFSISAMIANIAAGLQVSKFGAATVTTCEIINELVNQNLSKTGKLQSPDSLDKILTASHHQNQTVVFTNGCFDVLHRGHIEYLKFCKSQGDIVVLGLNSDNSIKQIKGPDRPINNQDDRAAVLASLESIDYIVIFDEPNPLNLIKTVRPNILIKGQDWKDKGVIGSDFVESYGGRVVLAKLVKGKSSTGTIEKIKSMLSK